jgi:hypothetical protein
MRRSEEEAVILKRDALAAQARWLIEYHGGDWDSPHAIVTLHPDGDGGLRAGTWTTVVPGFEGGQFAGLIARIAEEQQATHPEDPAYAYGYLLEGYGMEGPGPDSTPEYRERRRRAQLTRTYHEQPDRLEVAIAWVADIHGRSWQCLMIRGEEGVQERFFGPGLAPRGLITDGLINAARATGAAAWGIAPHSGGLN